MEITIRDLALSAFVFSAYSVQAHHYTPGIPAGTVLTNVSPIVIDGKKDVVIRNVRVSNPNGSCIWIKNSAQDILIENSEIGPCRNHGIDVTGSYRIIVRNSYIHDTTGNSIQTYKASGVTVWNNRLERGSSVAYMLCCRPTSG